MPIYPLKKFEDCLEKVTYTSKIQRKDFLECGDFPIVSQEMEPINGYWENEEDVFKIKKPVVIFGDHTQVIKYIDFDFVLGADGVKILQPKDFLNTKYLYYFLQSVELKSLGYARHYRLLKELQIPLPPLSVQEKIVAKLDAALVSIDEAKIKTQQALAATRELFESSLEEFFGGGEDWQNNNFKKITLKIGSGATPRGGKTAYKKIGISLVRSMNVHDRRFVDKNLAFIDDKQADELSNVILEKDDVLLNITGASVARCCIFPEQYLPARVNQHVSIIRPKKEILNPVFLNYLLTSKNYKDRLLLIGGQGATRQAITKAQIEDLVVSYPSLTEQSRIVTHLDAVRAETDRLAALYEQKLTDLDELRRSVLQEVFA